jgi:hypothetical protein
VLGVLSPEDKAALRLPSGRDSLALPMDDDSLSTCDDSNFRLRCQDNTDTEATTRAQGIVTTQDGCRPLPELASIQETNAQLFAFLWILWFLIQIM